MNDMTQPRAAISIQPRYALITPVRDEEKFVGDMIDSIVAQAVKPTRWIIVDDGSSDQTPSIVRAYTRRFDFIELVVLPPRHQRLAGGEGAVPTALRNLDLSQYDYLARFDADLVFSPDYISQILLEFDRDPKLGIAGGGLYNLIGGALKLERDPDHHVRGALKMYRRQCFEDIGGLTADIGWDTMDEVYAWTKGWKSKSFYEFRVIHRRPTGGGIEATLVYRERGRAEYLTWSHPLFVLAKAVKTALAERSILNSACYLAGFAACYWNRMRRVQDPVFAEARRRHQLSRLTFRPTL